jgi:cytochrome b
MRTDPIKRWLVSWLQQCLLRRAPQDDPLSYSALQWSIVAYVLMDLLQARASSDWPASLGMTTLDTLVMVLFAWTVLLLMKKSARLVQTLTALAGTGTVLGIVGLPLILQAAQTQAEGDPAGILVLGWLLMLVWSIAVQANIFRHALSTAYGSGLLLAGLHTVLIVTLVETLFPRAAG